MLFPHHVCHLDAQDHTRSGSGLEPKHWSHPPLDRAMILLIQVIQVAALPDPDQLSLAS